MRSLFWKIFVWFWAALVVIGVALYFVVLTTRPNPLPLAWRETASSAVTAYADSAIKTWRQEGLGGLERELKAAGENSNSIYWLFDTEGRKIAGPQLPRRGGGRPPRGDGAGRDGGRNNWRGEGLGDGGPPRRRDQGLGGGGPGGGGPSGFRLPWQAGPPDLSPNALRSVAAEAQESGEAVFIMTGRDVMVARLVGGGPGSRYLFVGLLPQPRFGRTVVSDSSQWLAALVVLGLSSLGCYALVHYLTSPLVALREATRLLAQGDLSARTHAAEGKRRDEVADLGRDFDTMADRIEILVKSERQLLGDISHELRSPLSRLTMALALARRHSQDDRVPPEMEAALDRIGRETKRLDALIAQLLELVRLESGDDYAVRELLDLESLTQDVVTDANFEAQAQDKGVVLESAGPVRLHGIQTLLQSAVENVVRNACRYTAPGTQVLVTLQRQEATYTSPSRARITVRDYGTGVPEASLPQLFRPFYRVESARDRNTGGVGLGLAITERAIAAHGGSVQARNAPGGGLEVTLTLPLE